MKRTLFSLILLLILSTAFISCSVVGGRISHALGGEEDYIMNEESFEKGIEKDELYELLNLVLNENYYTLLLGLDGEAALGNVQNAYKLYDEDGNLLNECGEIEEAAYRYFMEK